MSERKVYLSFHNMAKAKVWLVYHQVVSAEKYANDYCSANGRWRNGIFQVEVPAWML